ncbi:MAG: glycyl-radical enzyme activating protein [Bacteroidales bacterium]
MSKSLTIFNTQHYSVHDGPGIRTTIFLKGCLLNCHWCCNPESQLLQPQFKYNPIHCKQCGNCVKACSHQSVHSSNGTRSFDFAICNKCEQKSCLESCYQNALSVVGTAYSIDEVFKIIEKDREFYDNSGGGVTFSGGEPFIQAEALTLLLKRCKERNISTAVETCGYASTQKMIIAAEWVDMFLFDIKIVDNSKHIHYTGRSNRLILENLSILSKLGKRIIARIPLIPEATDNMENVRDIIAICKRNNISEATLGVYHRLGRQKYADFGIKYHFKHDDIIRDNDYYLNICQLFNEEGIKCELI